MGELNVATVTRQPEVLLVDSQDAILQRLHQLTKLRRGALQDEAGVVVQRCGVFMAPQATGAEIDELRLSITAGDFHPQLELGTDQHRQLADQHQPVSGNIAQVTDRLVGKPVEDFQVGRQLMPLDPRFREHAGYRYERSLSMTALVLRNGP